MKILHTSDWHLGKKLEGYSRIEEQEKFLEELLEISIKENIDMILIAGDIYDSSNPPVEAEKLYFKFLKKLSNNGERLIVVIAGNHDNPEKLLASTPFSNEYGIITFGKPLEKKEIGKYGKWEVIESCDGGILVEKNLNKLYINALPYPSEKELNEILNWDSKEYSKKIGDILQSTQNNFNKKIPSIIITHLFTLGAENEGTEREINLGGSLCLDLNFVPDVDYIALGHIHKSMKFQNKNAYYSGSPIEYRISESNFDKKVLIKDFSSKEIKEVILKNYKPIVKFIAKSIEEAINISENLKNEDKWIYLYINSERPLKNSELKEIKRNKNIIEIIPKILWNNNEGFITDYNEINVLESFKNFYLKKNNIMPKEELLKTFLNLIEELEYETN